MMLIGLLFSLLQVRVRSAEDLASLDLAVLGSGKKKTGARKLRFPAPALRLQKAY